MPKLIVSQFSCIDHAELNVAPLTVIIGPQASGKSVICKLLYFFYNIITVKFFDADEIDSWKDFQANLVAEFNIWFPSTAWGKKKFVITFSASPIEITITRTVSANRPGKNVRLVASDYLRDQFTRFRKLIDERKSAVESSKRPNAYEELFRIENLLRRSMERDLADNYFGFQTFVPAGRSFFTNIGKAVTVFERGGVLDPVTIAFGRLFTLLRDRWNRQVFIVEEGQHLVRRLTNRRQALAQQFFGGEIKVEKDKEYVISGDGRRIPFSILSSGQQELLPLWMTMEFLVERQRGKQLVYIEEPEAHLFPTAQGSLIEYLASALMSNKGLNLLITTHSPYVLAKLNNSLKAFSLSTKVDDKQKVSIAKIMPKDSWLDPRNIHAYAVIERGLYPILNEDGLIDAAYLDAVSGEIAEQFSQLMEIEFPQ